MKEKTDFPGMPIKIEPNHIPGSFELLGHTITVEWVEDLNWKSDARGEACYRENKIRIQRRTIDSPYSEDVILSTFYHELVHFIFLYAEKSELKDDEKLVNLVANLFMQFLKTRNDNTSHWIVPEAKEL